MVLVITCSFLLVRSDAQQFHFEDLACRTNTKEPLPVPLPALGKPSPHRTASRERMRGPRLGTALFSSCTEILSDSSPSPNLPPASVPPAHTGRHDSFLQIGDFLSLARPLPFGGSFLLSDVSVFVALSGTPSTSQVCMV